MYIAFDIGCLECGEPSGIIGVYNEKDEAEAAAEAAHRRQREDWHGEHGMWVFDTDRPEDYSQYREG